MQFFHSADGASAPPSAGVKLASYAYTLGNAGNRKSVLELGGRNVAYGYDNDYRLTSAAITSDPAGNNGTVSYNAGYDAVGNRTLMSLDVERGAGRIVFFRQQ